MADEKDNIPYPYLRSWMHRRIPLKKESKEEKLRRYAALPLPEKWISYIISKILKWIGFARNNLRFVYYKIIMRLLRFYFRIKYGMRVIGLENVPPEGAIFVINHIAGIDVVAPFISIFDFPVAAFTEIGDGFAADVVEDAYGWVARRGTASEMIEKMIRTLLLKNRYFAIWPEGTLEREGKIMQGFSGIVKVYAVVNSDRNRVPFVPVYMAEIKDRRPLIFRILKPFYIPRDWLKPPDKGGKTPREIIDAVMMKIAAVNGQDRLWPNPVLNRRRKDRTPWHDKEYEKKLRKYKRLNELGIIESLRRK